MHTISPVPTVRSVLPPISEPQSMLYKPQCAQYAFSLPGSIIQQGNTIVGNCTPNTANDPFAPPFDFQCSGYFCKSRDGSTGRTPNDICCPQTSPYTSSRCCRAPDINTCALCLDAQQGVTSSAAHFANMSQCSKACNYSR